MAGVRVAKWVRNTQRLRLQEKSVFQEFTKVTSLGASLFQLPPPDLSTLKCHFSKSLFFLASTVTPGCSCYRGSSGFKKHIPGRRGWRGWQAELKDVLKAFDSEHSKPFSRRFPTHSQAVPTPGGSPVSLPSPRC